MQDNYNLIVVGGGTAGCSAAYNAGKLGIKTLLIEKNSFLGGTITSSLVVPAMKTSENQINTDFFNELVSELTILGGQATYQGNKGWFNPELTKIALDRLMQKSNVDVLFNAEVSRIDVKNKHITGVYINQEMLSVYIGAKYIVDATGNCEIGKLANCEFLNTKNEKQPVSLRFEMSGIDLKTFAKWIMDFDTDRNVTTCEIINGQIHLSTACTDSGKWALRPLFEDAISNNILKPEDSKYFQVFTIPNKHDTLSFNCPRLYFDPEIDPLDVTKTSEALIKGRESILRLASFCKLYLPGFEKAYISTIANSLGIRVSRRIKGKYIYTENDLKTGKKFKTPVLIGNYPIDIHSSKKENSVLEFTNQDYEVPLEALMSADIDNLFVAGRCLSADFKAQAALRIQPACFSMGEGVAKYISTLL